MQIEVTKTERIFITVFNIIAPFLIGTAVDLYVPSMPRIAAYFHTTESMVQLTISLYMLGYAGGQLFAGILSDSFGRRRVFLFSLLFFVIVSFIAAQSPSIYILILCRFLQGLGIAGIGVSRRALVTDCFSGIELAKAMTLISISWAMGPIVGPYIGGYLQHYISWRANFYYFGIYGLLILIPSFFVLPETNLSPQKLRIKTVAQSMRTVLTSSAFMLGVLLLSLIYSLFVIFNTIGPFLIQITLKYSAIAYGRIALFMGIGYFLGNVSNRFLLHHFRSLTLVQMGLFSALFFALLSLMFALLVPINLYVIILPIFLLFLVCGWVFPNLMAKTMGLFPKIAGTASALFGTIVAGGVFLMTMFATTLKTTSQLPMVITYVVVVAICIGLFFVCKNKFVSGD